MIYLLRSTIARLWGSVDRQSDFPKVCEICLWKGRKEGQLEQFVSNVSLVSNVSVVSLVFGDMLLPPFPRRLQSEQNTHETLSRFSSDPREFFRVGNDANRLDLPLLHLNGQDGECFFASADDQGCLTVDFL